ncbi:MAG TPA: 3-hydroxyacyl-CoA dehydrogenase NAD-binding domain-containing protein [Bryobacteraceae bacterium]|nr:3-hydroxyacyl-CoA dehydrogenase NAD-binding domain-containing protein [Bryobacteraceae bacterium]
MSDAVLSSIHGDVALIQINRPPVNAIDRAVRAGLKQAFERLRADAEVGAIVVAGSGKTFVAGADIKEFESGIEEPSYHELFRLVEDMPVPVIAAVHGVALGAGTELALACHYRIATPNASFGLPELSLGLIPGAGGTQRLPRVIPFAAAADMILSGRPLQATQARALGLVDAIIVGDPIDAARRYGEELIASGKGVRKTRERPIVEVEGFDDTLAVIRVQASKTMPKLPAASKLIDALAAAVEKPFDEGLRVESEISGRLQSSDESRALRHLFFAEREVAKIAGLPASVLPRRIEQIGIVGAGTMGSGIAMAFANADIPVAILDSSEDALARARVTVRKNYERSVARGSLTAEQLEKRLQLIKLDFRPEALSEADLVIEAVFENLDVKKDVFAKLDKIAKRGAILATNTSTLDINVIAEQTNRPQDVIGLHFFSPANVMRLLEIVQAKATNDDVIVTALNVAKRIRKIGVVAQVCRGFIGNRMMEPYAREAEHCVLEGATPQEVDAALEEFGMAMGILAVFDMAGVDIGHLTRVAHPIGFQKDPTFYRPSALLTEQGWLGQKSGRGYYRYDGGKRVVDDEVVALLHAEGRRMGVPQRKPSAEEIRERCLFALVNEGARVLEERIASRSGDIDVVYTSGYGFPRYRGGPMFWADTVGLKRIYDTINKFRRDLDPRYWEPASLLEKLAMSGGSFTHWQSDPIIKQ